MLPFCAIGLFIGTTVNGQAAPAVINLIYLPMSFLSGLWMPLSMLPAAVHDIAPLWPAYHLGQLALAAVGQAYRGLGAAARGGVAWRDGRVPLLRAASSGPQRLTRWEANMRVIYIRLLLSGALLATMLVLGSFTPANGALPSRRRRHRRGR